MNDEVEFGRCPCLDLNDEIVKIAKSGEGVAVYYRLHHEKKTVKNGCVKNPVVIYYAPFCFSGY